MSTFIIPFQNVPQTFTIPLAGVSYTITCRWNDQPDAGWIMDISDVLTGDVLATNIPLVTGVDLLSGLEYLGIDGELAVYTNGEQFAVPTLLNLGVESNVYFVTDASDG